MNQGNNTVFYLFQCLFANFSSREKSMIYMSNLCSRVRPWSEPVLLHLISHINTSRSGRSHFTGKDVEAQTGKALVPGYKSFAQDFMAIMWQNQNLGPGGSDYRAQLLFPSQGGFGVKGRGQVIKLELGSLKVMQPLQHNHHCLLIPHPEELGNSL